MKSIFSIILIVCLPYINCGEPKHFISEVEKLDELSQNGVKINGVLTLEENGFLAECDVGFMYQGSKDEIPVTIKFTSKEKKTESDREFEMFKYLDAINNSKVERFGIPAIYYHDQWENYTVTAFTRLDRNLWDLSDEGWFSQYDALNLMILFKKFVIQSKYMHSRGVRHDHISQFNVYAHNNQTFLINFDFSAKLTNDKVSCANDNIGKSTSGTKPMFAMDDWAHFLQAMMKSIEVPIEIPRSSCCGSIHFNEESIVNEGLNRIVKRFIEEIAAGCSKVFPDYDAVDELISAEIRNEKGDDLAVFNWLLSGRKFDALNALKKNPVKIQTEIPQPK